MAQLATAFGCTIGKLPFTYLGLPLGTTKLLVKEYAPLICRVERRLSASSRFLAYLGRLQLISSVLSSLPTYYMCTLKLPTSVITQLNMFRKRCFWRGSDIERKGYNLAAWDLVCRLLMFHSVTNRICKHTDIVVGFHPRVFQGIVSTEEREYII